jgi:hypothetical protein
MTKTTKQDLRGISRQMQERSAVEAPAVNAGSDLNARLSQAWPRLQGEAASRWPDVPRADLEATGGDYAALCALLVERYQVESSEAERQVMDWLERHRAEEAG